MLRVLLFLFALAFVAPARAGEADTTLRNIQKKFAVPQGTLTTKDLGKIQNTALLYATLVRKFPGTDAAKEARGILDDVGGRLAVLKASLESEMAPKEEATKASLAKAQATMDRLRREIRAKAKPGAVPSLRAGGCVALDYGDEPVAPTMPMSLPSASLGGAPSRSKMGSSLYRVVVVKVSKVAPGEVWAKLLYRAKRGDAEAPGDAWKDFLAQAKDWEVPDEVFAGGLAVSCARGEELYREFAAAREVGRAVAPISQSLQKIRNILLTTKMLLTEARP